VILKTAKMLQLIAVVIDRDRDPVTKELLEQGVLHFINVREVEKGWQSKISQLELRVSLARISEVRKRIESLLEMGGLGRPPEGRLDPDRLESVALEDADEALDRLASEVHSYRENQRLIQQELLKMEDIRRQLQLFGNLPSVINRTSTYSFLSFQTGMVPAERVESLRAALRPLPSVLLTFDGRENRGKGTKASGSGPISSLLISMRRDEKEIERILDKHEWEQVELSPQALGSEEQVYRNLNEKISTLKSEQESMSRKVTDCIEKRRNELEEMWANLRMNELFYRIQSYFSKTTRTVIFSGWLPASKRRSLEEGLKRVTEGRCYLEWNEPEKESEEQQRQVPVVFTTPRWLAPFQMLVKNYSIPEYGTVDPTLFVAFAYLIMFGLMFGDAGHGLVLALVGILGSLHFKSKNEGAYQLTQLIIWCGASAIVMGVLFGSYFGMQWLKPLWFDYHGVVTGHAKSQGFVRDIYDVLLITIYFGISIIAVGLLLNWINLVSKREWKNLIFEKGGILGGWIYGAGVYVGFYFAHHGYKELPRGDLLFWLVGFPALLLVLKAPLDFISKRKKNPQSRFTGFSVMDFCLEWIVEMLEIFSGYLANTLSFMRVAGLGIAHVSLMMAFFEIAGMAGSPKGYTVWSILILVFGNLLVIALEGLSAGIQSLRLNYYEFFSKYFRGNGKAYMPVSLRSREEGASSK
jgi:V/A-type H+-transporting ATPase subunit I